jgi:hypothetical protein
MKLWLMFVACGAPSVEVESPFAVVSTSPSHGAVDVAADVEPRVGFNHAVDEATLEGVRLESGGSEIDVNQLVVDEDRVVVMVPVDLFTAGAQVDVIVDADVADIDGVALGSTHLARFVVVD